MTATASTFFEMTDAIKAEILRLDAGWYSPAGDGIAVYSDDADLPVGWVRLSDGVRNVYGPADVIRGGLATVEYDSAAGDNGVAKAWEALAEVGREEPYEAYDSAGRWLGWFGSAEAAEAAAESGYCSGFQQSATDLSAWAMWNDATQCGGASVLEDADGAQIIKVANSVFLRARKDGHSWEIEWLSREDMSEYYTGESLALRYANEPFVMQ